MDFIDEHVKEKQGVFFLIKMVLESYEIPKNLKDEYERMKQQCCDKEKNEIIDCIVEEGVREGLIRERMFSCEEPRSKPSFRSILCTASQQRKKSNLTWRQIL